MYISPLLWRNGEPQIGVSLRPKAAGAKGLMRRLAAALLAAASFPVAAHAQSETPPLYQYQENQRPHWVSPENPTGAPGRAAGESRR
jgi:hypothetical protein